MPVHKRSWLRGVRAILTAGTAAALALSVSPASAASVATWDKVAQCESGGNWSINTGNGYYGGLQFSRSTWDSFGGKGYAPYAHQATKQQQILIAERVLGVQGERAWPTCGPKAGLGRDHANPYPPTPTDPPGDAGMTDFVGGDFTGDGRSDVVARAKVNGTLFVYPGNGAGALEARRSMGTGWDSLDELTGGDFNGDGNTDIAARAKSDGTLFIYPGNGAGTFNSPIMAGTGWNHVEELTGGDFNGDGKADIAARAKSDGTLFIYPGNGAGTFDSPIMAGTGWNHLEELTGGDFNSDGKSDIAARAKSDGTLFIYPGNGASTFNSPVSAGSGWNIMRDIFSADLNGDGNTDITGVQAPQGTTGNMYLYPGTGQNTFATRHTLGTGW
ncbi:transglycosylase family protein [Streptomyces sp. AC536]|uniref:FG-GAP-like repeat-containing protein n=4 Tax=Streptomyces buecherae TaxID=2763006 RepID=UPI00164EBE98|nr:FG-GAP-like repeat-containing protein [Streptomyces buecherae]MBC3985660.1 transglycosylase family protein [Streptomyces buecherae]QNJ39407.1 transglycosylase family protein [Streptomyces buecherae]